MKRLKFVLPFVLLGITGSLAAADLDGAQLYTDKTCVTCHGAGGNAPIMDTYPKLGGQTAAYLVSRLKAYKAAEISGGQAAVMTPMAALLNEEEMDAVAKYLESSTGCEPAAESATDATESSSNTEG